MKQNILFLDCSWGITEAALQEALSRLPKEASEEFENAFYLAKEAAIQEHLAGEFQLRELYGGEIWTSIRQALRQLKIEAVYYSPLPWPRKQGLQREGLIWQKPTAFKRPLSPLVLLWLAVWAKPSSEMPAFQLRALSWGDLGQELTLPLAWGMVPKELEKVIIIETNIDDQNPQIWGYLLPKLLQRGALDAYLTAIQMKKNRPGQLLTVLVPEEKVSEIADLILSETTTLGLRIREEKRLVLPRSFEELTTPWGKVRVKTALTSQGLKRHPEYEDCRRIAEEQGRPLLQVYQKINRWLGAKAEENER